MAGALPAAHDEHAPPFEGTRHARGAAPTAALAAAAAAVAAAAALLSYSTCSVVPPTALLGVLVAQALLQAGNLGQSRVISGDLG